jgi:hypothetical protein
MQRVGLFLDMQRVGLKQESRKRPSKIDKALEAQKQRRLTTVMLSRQLALAEPKPSCENPLMMPERTADLPEAFSEWYFTASSMGTPCLVATGHGKTIARDTAGHIFDTFSTMLPGGSFATRAEGTCLLHCVWDGRVFCILDVMVWNACHFYDCDKEFRVYWASTQISAIPLELSSQNTRVMVLLNWTFDIPEGECVYAMNKEAHYYPGESSPLYLLRAK